MIHYISYDILDCLKQQSYKQQPYELFKIDYLDKVPILFRINKLTGQVHMFNPLDKVTNSWVLITDAGLQTKISEELLKKIDEQ